MGRFIVIFIAAYLGLQVVGYGQEKNSKGNLSGQLRTYYQTTVNKDSLRDFQTLATGGKVKYTHSFFKGKLNLGGALYISFNTGIQDMSVTDSYTSKLSRYELGMYDVTDPAKRFIALPGELYVKYNSTNHEVTVGRMKIVSPFLNPEDGRMIPTLEQGVLYKFKTDRKLKKLQLGVFNAIAPRSTSKFYNIGESIGTYPVGKRIDGSNSYYAGNVDSRYIALANINYVPTNYLKIDIWDYFVDNTFHSIYLKPTTSVGAITFSVEWLHQDKINNGGNDVDSLSYFEDIKSNVVGAELSWESEVNKVSIGYDYILDGGRFLFPREWGREFLFSFQKRERSEGSANNHGFIFTYLRNSKLNDNNKIKTILSVGYHWKSPANDWASNKYGFPSYSHINFDLFYTNSGKLKSLKPELLLTYKIASGDYPENPNFVINKVDMFQVNFVVNYTF